MSEIANRTPAQELVATLRTEDFKGQVALALPEHVTPERFIRIAITALQANPDTAELERGSVLRAMLQSAALGLMPDGKEAAIVGFKGSAQLIPMIGGFRKIAAEHGWTLITRAVYEADEFEHHLGTDENILHRPVAPGVERGELVAAYAIAKHTSGAREVEVMTRAEIEKVRAVSRAAARGPWVEWYERMAEKSVGRRLFAKLPLGELDPRVQRIIEASKSEPADAAEAIYGTAGRAALGSGTPPVKPGESDGHGTEPVARQQVAGAADASHEGATAAAPATPDPDSPEGESPTGEPEQIAFHAPAGALDEDAALAQVAAETMVDQGKYKGKTLAQVAGLKGGELWLAMVLTTPGHSLEEPVAAFTRVLHPEIWNAAQAKKAAA